MEGEPLRVALYARVSSEEQKQGQTINSQIDELKHFVAQNNWHIHEVYADEACSGAILARPALDRLRDEAAGGRFEAVLINDVDRLARNVAQLGIIKRDLERAGVRVIFRKIPSSNDPTYNLLVNVLGSFAEFEREMILDRTRRGRRHKAEVRQQFIGSLAPYGYRYVAAAPGERDGRLVIEPGEAAMVRQIYSWVDVQHLSARKVVDRLNAAGATPRKRGPTWQKSTVLRILRCSVYAGVWYYNKHQLCVPRSIAAAGIGDAKKTSNRLRAKEEWIPVKLPESLQIVAKDQWDRVQNQIDQNRSMSPRNSRHEYLLSGLLRCGGCMATYVGDPAHGRFGYRCARRCKRFPAINEESLNGTVWTAVQNALNQPDLIRRAIKEVPNATAIAPESVQLENAYKQVTAEEGRILEAYRLEVLSSDQLASELRSIAARRRLLDKQKAELAHAQPLPARLHDDVCKEFLERLSAAPRDKQRTIIRSFVRKIVFEGNVVRIFATLPVDPSRRFANTTPNRHGPNSPDARRIATTIPGSYGRNDASWMREKLPLTVDFELKADVIPDRTRAIAASRANLVKATAARWPAGRKAIE